MAEFTPAETARAQIIGALWMLADRRQQWDYERQVPIADVPSELLEIGSEILSLAASVPEAMTESEQQAVEQVGWVLADCTVKWPISLIEMQHEPSWLKVMAAARAALEVIVPGSPAPEVEDLSTPNPLGNWEDYFEAVSQVPLHPLYAELDKHLPAAGDTLELACGLGKGAIHLAGKGLEVWATDISGEALTYLFENAPPQLRPKLHLYVSMFTNLDLAPEVFDLVVAAFCLFFMSPPLFSEKWPLIAASIRPNGMFMGQFLGANDDWATMGYTTHTREEVSDLLNGFELLHFEEVDRDGKTSQGTEKHWNVFHVIARKSP